MDNVPAAVDSALGPSNPRALRSKPLLVGRTLEQAFLREELAAVIGGHGRLVLLGGEAGIGKTTLARDVASEAIARGVRVLIGSCYDLTNTPPYGPWLEIFDRSALDHTLPSPPSAFAGGQVAPITDQAMLFAEARHFFAELAASGPTLLVLEDLHWADPASLELLRHLAPRVRYWPLLMLLTYRGDELTRRHPFAVQLPTLVREADGLRLDLHRLDEDALDALVTARYRLASPDKSRLVAYLKEHAEGNPLFTTEILRALEEEALLRPVDDGWELAAIDRVVIPRFLRQVIEGRVARLGEETRQPLAMAAVIGHEVPLALWTAVADLSEEALLTIVEQAVDAHLLEAYPDGKRVRFVHALTREALYLSVLPTRRQLWHRRVGDVLAASSRPDPDAVAYHFQAAGDQRARAWLLKAGDRAQVAYAWLTAAERFQAAAALTEIVEGEERTHGRLMCRIAFLKRFSDPAGAIEAIDTAAQVAAQIKDPVMAAQARWLRGLLLCYLDQFRSGLDEMIGGIEALKAMPPAVAMVPTTLYSWLADALPTGSAEDASNDGSNRSVRIPDDFGSWRAVSVGRFLASAGHLRAAIDDCEGFVAALGDQPEEDGSLRVPVAFAAHALGIAQANLGRPAEARTSFARARADFAALGHHAMVAFTLLSELADVALTYESANPARRRWLTSEAEAALDRTGGALRPGVSPRVAHLSCFILDGRWQDADRVLRDMPAPGNAFLRREITAANTFLSHHRGNVNGAWKEISSLLRNGPATEPGDIILQEGLCLQRLAAEMCLDGGDPSAAHAWLRAHDRWIAWSESVLGDAAGRVSWAQYHLATGDHARARASAVDGLARAIETDQPLVRLAGHRVLGEIETASTNYLEAEDHFTEAIDLAITCDAPFERARTLLALAHLRVASGRIDDVSPLLDECRAVCGPLGAAPTLARTEALAMRLIPAPKAQHDLMALTQREAEILRLLPGGYSNAEIAARLFISPRTVQTHLSNLYSKLGVGGRVEAIMYAVGRGLD